MIHQYNHTTTCIPAGNEGESRVRFYNGLDGRNVR